MSYTLQLRDVQNSSIKNIAGVCVTSDAFKEMVNETTQRLMRRGGWWNTEQTMKLCVQGCHVVYPRQVGTVLGLRFCRSGAVQLKNNWWSVYGYRSCSGWAGGWGWRGDAVARDDGTRPCYNEVTGNTGKYITARIVKINDVGKTIRIFGTQFGNQPIQEQDANGNWVMGLTLTLTQAGVTTTMLVTKITSVVKEVTEGRVLMYEVDPSTAALYDLAVYEPDETNPSYRCHIVSNWGGVGYFTDSYGRRIRQVEALVKLEFVPVRTEDDFLLLDNLMALKFGIEAFRLYESGDDAAAEAKTILAIRELNFEIRDREPGLQTTIRVNSISGNYPIFNPI